MRTLDKISNAHYTMEFQLSKIALTSYLVLFLTLPNLPHNVAADNSTEEAHALLRWKASLHCKTKPFLSSWLETRTSPCSWFGVSCNRAGSVSGIILPSAGLIGTLQNFLFSSFPNLVYFNLSMNELHGSIPSELSQLYRLIYLDLSMNRFSGKIPSSVGLLTHLEVLDLSENQLSDSIPEELGQLKSLIKLVLHNNNIHGQLPCSLGNLCKRSRQLSEHIHHRFQANQYSDKVHGPGGGH